MNKRTLEKFLKQFHTDEEGFVVWKGIKVRTKAGFLQSKFKNGNVSWWSMRILYLLGKSFVHCKMSC